MGASLHVSLPDEMRRFVDAHTNGNGRYATPSEYVRDLIRRDMEGLNVELRLLRGLDEANRGAFAPADFLDKLIEEIK